MNQRSIPLLSLVACLGLPAAPAAAAALEWTSGDFKIAPAGYIQGDLRAFPNWDLDVESGAERNEEAELRRARVGFEGEWKRVSFEAMVDLAGAGERAFESESVEPRFRMRRDLKDLWVQVEASRAFRLRLGHMKLPVSRERLTSVSRTPFVERSLLADALAPDRDFGAMALGSLGGDRPIAYMLGIFAGDSHERGDRAAGATVAGRLVATLSSRIELAASASRGRVEADPEDPVVEPEPKGLSGDSASGWNYSIRKQVNGVRLRLGLDGQATLGRLTFEGEALRVTDERLGQGSTLDDLPSVVGLGWSATASVRLAGRVKGEKKKKGEPRGVVESADLHFRFESLRFDDDGENTGFEGTGARARNIRPADDRAFSAGVSVWPREWMRVMGTVVVDRYLDPLLAPEAGRRGNYVTVLGRLQFVVP